jgi:hypothetical protein
MAATDTHTTIKKKLLEAVFSVRSVQRLYKEEKRCYERVLRLQLEE